MFTTHRPVASLPVLVVILIACATLNACSGKGAASDPGFTPGAVNEDVAASFPAFPAPSTLVKQPSIPPQNPELRMEADRTTPLIAANRTFDPGIGILEFHPNWDPAASPTGGDLAYAGYEFVHMSEYAGEAGITLEWQIEPTDYSDLYIGMGNLALDAWDWFSGSDTGFTQFPSMDDYIAQPSGEVFMIVLMTGTDNAELSHVMLGNRLNIVTYVITDLDLDPSLNIAPQLVNFDATSSYVLGGTIVSYDFDFDDDGTFEITGDTTGLASHTFTNPGLHAYRIRVYDDIGRHADESAAFWLVDPANVPPTAFISATPPIGAAPLSVLLDASGSTDDVGIEKYEWDLDGDGIYEFDAGIFDSVTHIFAARGTNTVGLRVTDQDYAQDTTTQNITLNSGFEYVTITTGHNIRDNTSMVMSGSGVGERPCVAWQDSSNKDLWFARAMAADGSTWGAPLNPVMPAADTGYCPVMTTNASSRPVIAYGMKNTSDNEHDLQTCYAMIDDCTLWSGPHDVNVDDHVGQRNGITKINFMPAIVSVANYGVQGVCSVRYYLSTDGNGENWGPGFEVLPAQLGAQLGGVDIIQSFDGMSFRPVVAYGVSGSSAETTGFGAVPASAADGSSWSTPVFFEGRRGDTVSIHTPGGTPSFCAGNSSQVGALNYVAADNPGGTLWTDPPVNIASGGHGGSCNLAIVNSLPAICYYSFDGGDLWFVTAQNAIGSAWNEPYRVASIGNTGRSCSMVVYDGDRPIICYFNDTTDELVCAYWNP